jgi:hypothetical protein
MSSWLYLFVGNVSFPYFVCFLEIEAQGTCDEVCNFMKTVLFSKKIARNLWLQYVQKPISHDSANFDLDPYFLSKGKSVVLAWASESYVFRLRQAVYCKLPLLITPGEIKSLNYTGIWNQAERHWLQPYFLKKRSSRKNRSPTLIWDDTGRIENDTSNNSSMPRERLYGIVTY